MKYILQILALACGSVFGFALALFLGFFGYENLFLSSVLTIYGLVLLIIIIFLLLVKETKDNVKYIRTPLSKIVKSVISWTIHNYKFIFIPGRNYSGRPFFIKKIILPENTH